MQAGGKNHQRLHVERSGDGPPLILTHGLGDSTTTWSELTGILAEKFTTFAWDLLGHGRSALPTRADEYSREIALADLDGVIERAGREVTLIGHSLGGYLSQCRAVKKPAGIRALVLIATGPGFSDPARREEWNRYVGKAGSRFEIPAAAVGMARQYDDLVMANLGRIALPVLQIVGEKDTGYHGAFDVLERRVSNITSLRVSGAGHHVHRSHAAEVGRAILSFLEALD